MQRGRRSLIALGIASMLSLASTVAHAEPLGPLVEAVTAPVGPVVEPATAPVAPIVETVTATPAPAPAAQDVIESHSAVIEPALDTVPNAGSAAMPPPEAGVTGVLESVPPRVPICNGHAFAPRSSGIFLARNAAAESQSKTGPGSRVENSAVRAWIANAFEGAALAPLVNSGIGLSSGTAGGGAALAAFLASLLLATALLRWRRVDVAASMPLSRSYAPLVPPA